MKIVLLLVAAAVLVMGQRTREERLVQQPVRGTRGAVAAGSPAAAAAGMRLLEKGGNAVDAGVAAMLAAAVVEYSHFGFGGEAPILIHTAEGRVASIAGVGTMPKLATADLFRQRTLGPGETYLLEPFGLKHMVPTAGVMAALVPGMVDAALLSLKEFGTRSFGEVAQPAMELADVAIVDEERSLNLRGTSRLLQLWPSTSRIFLPNGRVPRPGDTLRQVDLARTLRQMGTAEQDALKRGASRALAIEAIRDAFYRGDIGQRIAAFVEQQGGLLRREDMAAFRLKVEEPVSVTFRDYTVYKPGFWSQGPAMLEALNLLEALPLTEMGLNSAEYVHTVTEALKLAYADRDTFYGDPDFVKVPAAQLLSKNYAAARRGLIGNSASPEFRPGTIAGFASQHPSQAGVSTPPANATRDTTCVSVIDSTGTVFTSTPSGAWLPFVIAGDTGIPLTQRAQSFLLLPGHPNELAGGKRPRVTLSPTLVLQNGKPVLAMSTPGGDNQEQAQVQVLLNTLLFGQNAQRAVETARFQTHHLVSSFDNHGMIRSDLVLDERIPVAVVRDLSQRGHKVEVRSKNGSEAAPVMIRILANGVIEAGADPFAYRVARAW